MTITSLIIHYCIFTLTNHTLNALYINYLRLMQSTLTTFDETLDPLVLSFTKLLQDTYRLSAQELGQMGEFSHSFCLKFMHFHAELLRQNDLLRIRAKEISKQVENAVRDSERIENRISQINFERTALIELERSKEEKNRQLISLETCSVQDRNNRIIRLESGMSRLEMEKKRLENEATSLRKKCGMPFES